MAVKNDPMTIEALAKRLDSLEKENNELKARLTSMERSGGRSRDRAGRSNGDAHDEGITDEAVADILGGFIENFNTKARKRESPVGYMISNMEIELKTQVVKDGDELVFMAADPDAVPETISTVRMEVRAIPGDAAKRQ